MNCKQGELAVIVRCNVASNLGRIVRVVGRHDPESWFIDGGGRLQAVDESTGKVYPERCFDGVWEFDANLRPIRDQDGEDESLTWAPKPEKVEA